MVGGILPRSTLGHRHEKKKNEEKKRVCRTASPRPSYNAGSPRQLRGAFDMHECAYKMLGIECVNHTIQ